MKQKIALFLAALFLILGPCLKAQPVLETFSTSAWGATASASSSSGTNTPNLAIDGSSTTGWVGGTGKAYLIVAFSAARAIDEIHVGKGGAAPTGSSMPTAYTINLYNGATLVRTIVNETSNTQADVYYELPGITHVTSMWILVNATLNNNLPYINQFDGNGPFIPTILAPDNGQTVNNSTYSVRGYTQPGASVALTLNGALQTAVTADSGGWFADSVLLASGPNTIIGTATLPGHTSGASGTTTATYSATGANTFSLITREGAGVAYDEGINNALVTAGGQGTNVVYNITDENNSNILSNTIDLSHGSALISLPSSMPGWYQIVVNTTPPLTQTVSILSNHAVLPLTSRISSDVALAQPDPAIPAGDLTNFPTVVSDFAGKVGYGWLRERIQWTKVNGTNGVYNFTPYDTDEHAITQQGQSIMPNVYYFPAYAGVNSHNDYRYVPENLYTTYLWGKTLATHYSDPSFNGLIKGFEFQNEADYNTTDYKQTVNTIMGHQKAFYLGVKAGNPNMMVMPNPPALVVNAANELQNLRGEAADVFTFHWYPAGRDAANLTNLQTTMAANMQTITNMVLNPAQPINNRSVWLSECGFLGTAINSTNSPANNSWSADEQIQADFLSKMGPLAMANGIDRPFGFIFPFDSNPSGSGIMRQINFSPRPGMNASEITAQLMQTATYYGPLIAGSNITGLVFQNANGSFLLEIWAANSAGTGSFTLPNGVTDVNVVDYLGRPTDTLSTTAVVVQTTAKFVTLSNSTANNNAIKSPLFSTAANLPAPNYLGTPPSPVVMEWHFTPDLPCKTAASEDYYDLVNNTATTGHLEVVNTSTTVPFSGTINVSTSNQRWQFVNGQSLTVSNLPVNGGRTTINFTLTAPALTDTVRLEARVDDNNVPSQTSSAAEILQTTGSATPVNAIVEDGTGAASIPCYVSPVGVAAADQNSPVQNYLCYDGHLAWTPGTDGLVTYEQALPSTGTQSFSTTQKFRAPVLHYTAGLLHSLHLYYYVWIKAKAPSNSGVCFDIVQGGVQRAAPTEINGFNTTSWTWSRTAVTGEIAKFATGTFSGTANHDVSVWPANDGVQIAAIVIRTDSSSTPPSF